MYSNTTKRTVYSISTYSKVQYIKGKLRLSLGYIRLVRSPSIGGERSFFQGQAKKALFAAGNGANTDHARVWTGHHGSWGREVAPGRTAALCADGEASQGTER